MANKKTYEMLTALRDELNDILGGAPEEEAPKKTTKKSTAADEGDFDSMAYNDLKKLCKERGLSAAGNREELIARLSGEVDEDEDDEPVKKPTSKKGKKSAPVEEEDEDEEEDDEDDEDDEDEDDEEDIQSAVEAATEDMSLEELAEFCEENGLSSKGKRQALIARIVKAVEAGDIELSDDDEDEDDEEEEEPAPKKKGSAKSDKKTSKKAAPADDEDDEDEEEEDEETEPTKERLTALKAYEKDTRAQFKKGEIERDDIVEFLSDFYDKDKKTYKKMSDKEVLDAYIEASSNLISDEGEIVEEGAYTVNGVPFCCGRPLSYDEDEGQYVCEHCGGEYEADDDE